MLKMNTIQKYLESPEVKGLAKSTQDLYRHALGHAERFLSSVVMGTESSKERWISGNIELFVDYLEKQNLSGKSIQQYLTCTKIFLFLS